ncbi:hypothetical protein HBI17_053900 [Parastagonospora nodorum]|nr:hypothetical protein HBI29_081300 [Parastagonospora nodorum]KAH5762544.1 hypothetical protein HBI17_053900 [Parastagonospora nodorum]
MILPSTAALLLGVLTSLAASTPLRESTALDQPYTNTTTLERRGKTTDPWHFCSDKNWSSFGERAFLAGLRLMGKTDDRQMRLVKEAREQIPDYYMGVRGMCENLWCGGNHSKGRGVVFYLCLHDTTPDGPYLSGDLAQKFHDGFYDCNGEREPQDDPDNKSLAFHVWEAGYDLHVEGGYDGMKCPGDTKKTRFRRPSSLDSPPYT